MPLDPSVLELLRSCCKDDAAFEKARQLFHSCYSRSEQIQETLQHTIDTLQGEARERIKLEALLSERESFYRAIFENASIGIAYTDARAQITRANHAFCDMLGYSEAELAALTVEQITHPDDYKRQAEFIEKMTVGNIANYEFVKRYIRKDGKTIWGRIYASAHRNARGELDAIVVVRDITKEVEAEARLKHSEAQLAWLLNALPFAIAIYKNKVPIFGNRAFYDSRGLRDFEHWLNAKAQETTNDDYALIHPDDYDEFVRNIEDYRKRADTGELIRVERRIRRWGETEHLWYECSIFKGDYIDGEKVVVEVDVPIEARKRAELALKESQRRLENIVSQMGDFLVVVDSLYCLTLFNKRVEETLLQVKPDLKLGDNFLNLVYKRKALWKDAIDRAFEGEVVFIPSESYSPVHPENKAYYETTIYPIEDCEGHVSEVAILTTDVSERKRSELEILKIQNLLSETERLAKIGSWEYDIRTGETFWTDEVYRIYERDFSKPPLKDEAYYAQIHPDDLEAMKAAHQNIMLGKSYDVTIRIIADSGKVKWVQTIGTPIIENGKAIRMVGTIMDVTERIQAEEDLRRSEAMLSETERLAKIGSWRFDLLTGTLNWSDEAYRIYERDPALGTPNYDAIFAASPDAEAIKPIVERALQSGNSFSVTKRIVVPSGQTKWVEVIGSPIRDGNGVVTNYQGYIRDITREKQIEAEKESLYQQLLQSQKMESIGVLASGVAHEFNNILAGILGAAALLKKEVAGNPKGEKRVAQIEENSQRAATIVKQMLGFARQGKMQVQAVDLRECVSNVLTLLEPTLDKRVHISTNFQVHDARATIKGDKGQLEQVILNLAVNARDALMSKSVGKEMPEISFSLSCEPLPKKFAAESSKQSAQPFLHLAVSDNGIGIPKDIQSKIFEPFFTTKEVGKGTGLGLSMVYGIVKNHQGFIDVESEAGKGTTFHLYFPFSEATGAPPIEAQSSVPVSSKKGTILVVDDEPLVREFIAELLEDDGYSVYVEKNGKDGFGLFQKNNREIDLVVIDKNMPELDGETLLAQIRALRPTVKMILITGYLQNDELEELESKGAFKVFTKPFEPRQFLAAVASALQSP